MLYYSIKDLIGVCFSFLVLAGATTFANYGIAQAQSQTGELIGKNSEVGEQLGIVEFPRKQTDGNSNLYEQNYLPLPQKVSTSAADLLLDEFKSLTLPLTAEVPNQTDPPQLQSSPLSEGKESSDQLEQVVRDSENPLVDRIRIPIINRTAFDVGPFERTANVTIIRPLVPISIGENYLFLRTSIPFVYSPTLNQIQGEEYGLGDIRMQTFFGKEEQNRRLTWGIGPTFLFPTASERSLGFGKWGIGPSVAALWAGERLTAGGILENYWSFAGDENRPDVSQLTLQPLFTYVLRDGWYLASSPVITAFWNIPQGGKWLVPIGGGLGKVIKSGDYSFNMSVQAYWHPVRPDNSEGWALVLQFQSLFPRVQSKLGKN